MFFTTSTINQVSRYVRHHTADQIHSALHSLANKQYSQQSIKSDALLRLVCRRRQIIDSPTRTANDHRSTSKPDRQTRPPIAHRVPPVGNHGRKDPLTLLDADRRRSVTATSSSERALSTTTSAMFGNQSIT